LKEEDSKFYNTDHTFFPGIISVNVSQHGRVILLRNKFCLT